MARRRRYRRHNPIGLINPRRRRSSHRRNPYGLNARDPFGIDLEASGGAIAGAIGTAYVDAALVGPYLGGLFKSLGKWQPAAQAITSAVGVHWLSRRFLRKWSGLVGPGANLYAVVGVANTAMPGVVPITIGVPKQLANLHFFGVTQPLTTPAQAGAVLATGPATAGALPAAAGGGSTVLGQTNGRRILAPNGL